jgi:predicted nucleic acid-binding protein
MKLKPGDILFLDTAPFVYFFEQQETYFPALKSLFADLYAVGAQAITSIITYIELTTHPARLGKQQLVRKYRDYFSNSENISLFPLDLHIADQVVALRGKYGLKTPEAIQLGTAVACGADYILTNDQAWKRFEEVRVVLVGDLLPPPVP